MTDGLEVSEQLSLKFVRTLRFRFRQVLLFAGSARANMSSDFFDPARHSRRTTIIVGKENAPAVLARSVVATLSQKE